jgi:predicted RNA-binding protein
MYREHGDMTGAAQQKAAEHFNPEHSNKVRRIKREDRLKAQDMKEQASLYDAEQVNRAEADAWPKQGSLSDSEFRRELQEARKIFPYVDDVISILILNTRIKFGV